MGNDVVSVIDNEFDLSISDIKEMGIEDFSMDKDDLFFVIEETIREQYASKMIEIVQEMSNIWEKVVHKRADYFVSQFSDQLDEIADLVGTEALPILFDTWNFQSFLHKSVHPLFTFQPSLDEVLNYLDNASRKNYAQFLGHQFKGIIVVREDSCWSYRLPSFSQSLRDLKLDLQKEYNCSLKLSTRKLQYKMDSEKTHRDVAENVTKFVDESKKVRFSIGHTKKSISVDDVVSEEEKETYKQGYKQVKRIYKAFDNLDSTMKRSKSRLYKKLIKGAAEASDDGRAEKLQHLILSIAQKPISMLEDKS